jgi:hypothetical protein
MIQHLKLNWKTSAAGLAILLTTLGNALSQYLQGGLAAVNITVLLAGLSGAFAAFAAKDGNVTGGTKPATEEALTRVASVTK